MSKVTKSATLDVDVWKWLGEQAKRREMSSESSMINYIINKVMDEEKIASYKILICSKCNSKYSSKLPSCPSCEAEEILQMEKDKEEAIKKQEEKDKLFLEIRKKEQEELEQRRARLKGDIEKLKNFKKEFGEEEGEKRFNEYLKQKKEAAK